MAFTQADVDALKSAMLTIGTEGIASVNIDGHNVTVKSLQELEAFLRMVESDVAKSNAPAGRGIGFSQMVPGGCG